MPTHVVRVNCGTILLLRLTKKVENFQVIFGFKGFSKLLSQISVNLVSAPSNLQTLTWSVKYPLSLNQSLHLPVHPPPPPPKKKNH